MEWKAEKENDLAAMFSASEEHYFICFIQYFQKIDGRWRLRERFDGRFSHSCDSYVTDVHAQTQCSRSCVWKISTDCASFSSRRFVQKKVVGKFIFLLCLIRWLLIGISVSFLDSLEVFSNKTAVHCVWKGHVVQNLISLEKSVTLKNRTLINFFYFRMTLFANFHSFLDFILKKRAETLR